MHEAKKNPAVAGVPACEVSIDAPNFSIYTCYDLTTKGLEKVAFAEAVYGKLLQRISFRLRSVQTQLAAIALSIQFVSLDYLSYLPLPLLAKITT